MSRNWKKICAENDKFKIEITLHRQGPSLLYPTIAIFPTHTAKKKCRKFEANFPRKGISGPQSQFPHSCVCERIIYSHDGAAVSASSKTQTHECRNWGWGRAIPRKGIYKRNCLCSAPYFSLLFTFKAHERLLGKKIKELKLLSHWDLTLKLIFKYFPPFFA